MQKSQEERERKEIISAVIEAIRSRKGANLIDLNIDKISQTVCSHFIICEAPSYVQVQAIAQAIEDQLQIQFNKKPFHKEGVQNGVWILLDYADIVVHVFQEESRRFYNLEGLWGDGKLTKYDS